MAERDDNLRPDSGDVQIVAGETCADAQFASHRPAASRSWLLVATLEGAGRIDATGRNERLTRGDLVLVRPDAAASVWRAARDATLWWFAWIHFRPRAAWLAWLNDWPGVADDGHGRLRVEADAGQGAAIIERLRDVCRISAGPHTRRDALAANALEQALLWCDAIRHESVEARRPPDDRILAAADWLCRNLGGPITLERIAAQAGLSVSRLAHRFRDEMGVPPLQYLERQRMRRARDLLSMTTLSVAEVAQAVGYENVAYFSTRFRKAVGATPDGFRQCDHVPPTRDEAPPPESTDDTLTLNA